MKPVRKDDFSVVHGHKIGVGRFPAQTDGVTAEKQQERKEFCTQTYEQSLSDPVVFLYRTGVLTRNLTGTRRSQNVLDH